MFLHTFHVPSCGPNLQRRRPYPVEFGMRVDTDYLEGRQENRFGRCSSVIEISGSKVVGLGVSWRGVYAPESHCFSNALLIQARSTSLEERVRVCCATKWDNPCFTNFPAFLFTGLTGNLPM